MSNKPASTKPASTVLLILGKETGPFARGQYNQGLFDAAVETLSPNHTVLTTVIEDGYDIAEEIDKFKQADTVIYQYPVFWFMMPASLKEYMDTVFQYGAFFDFKDGPYGGGGLMTGRKVMLSTTWNAPAEAFGDPAVFFGGQTPSEVLAPMRKAHAYCGFIELPHFSCHDVVKAPDFPADRARLVRHLHEVFGGAGVQAA